MKSFLRRTSVSWRNLSAECLEYWKSIFKKIPRKTHEGCHR